MKSDFLLYGSYGYTGSLIARTAVEAGLRPLLAGRDRERLAKQSNALNLEFTAFSLNEQSTLDSALRGTPFVLHCAGPYVKTCQPMAEACLRLGVDYVDITGEISVFQYLESLDTEARQNGVMFLPGAGFDVVPSDCLALYLKQCLPSATYLDLAVRSVGSGYTHGTALSTVGIAFGGGWLRREGRLEQVQLGKISRNVDFGRGPVRVHNSPLADIISAWHSTGIPNIRTFTRLPGSAVRILGLIHNFSWLLNMFPVQALLRRYISTLPAGPTEEQLRVGRGLIWGEVHDAVGNGASALLETPEAYYLTAQTAVAIARCLLNGQAKPGFWSPAGLFGADFILQFPGVIRSDCKSM